MRRLRGAPETRIATYYRKTTYNHPTIRGRPFHQNSETTPGLDVDRWSVTSRFCVRRTCRHRHRLLGIVQLGAVRGSVDRLRSSATRVATGCCLSYARHAKRTRTANRKSIRSQSDSGCSCVLTRRKLFLRKGIRLRRRGLPLQQADGYPREEDSPNGEIQIAVRQPGLRVCCA